MKTLPVLSVLVLAWIALTLLLVPQAIVLSVLGVSVLVMLAVDYLRQPRERRSWLTSAEAQHIRSLDAFSFLFYVLGFIAWALLAALLIRHEHGAAAMFLTVSGSSYREIIKKAQELLDAERCMKRVAERGHDPYDSATAAASCFRKLFRDKGRAR